MATGDATPRSDADLLVEVSASPYAHHRDRVPEILGAFRPLPCPLDIVVFTSEELSRPWGVARTALEQGTDLLDRPL